MKKVLSLAFVLVIVVSIFASCGAKNEVTSMTGQKELNGKTVFQAYNQSVEKIKTEITNYEYVLTQKQTMSYAGTTIGTYTTVEAGKMNGDWLEAQITSDILGNSSIVWVDDWYYILDTKQKANFTKSELIELLYGQGFETIFDGYLLNLPEEWLSNVTFVKYGSGYKSTMTVDGNKYLEKFMNTPIIEKLMGSLSMNMNITEFQCVIYFDENADITSVDQFITFNVTVEGITIKDVVNQKFEISNIGGVGEIKAPSDTSNYYDITEMMKNEYGR